MLAAQCNKLSSMSPPPLADAAVGKGFHPWKKGGSDSPDTSGGSRGHQSSAGSGGTTASFSTSPHQATSPSPSYSKFYFFISSFPFWLIRWLLNMLDRRGIINSLFIIWIWWTVMLITQQTPSRSLFNYLPSPPSHFQVMLPGESLSFRSFQWLMIFMNKWFWNIDAAIQY